MIGGLDKVAMVDELVAEFIVEAVKEAGPIGGAMLMAPLGGNGAQGRLVEGVEEGVVEAGEGQGGHDLLWLLMGR